MGDIGRHNCNTELCIVADTDMIGSKKLGYKIIILRWSEVKQIIDTLMLVMTPLQLVKECNDGHLRIINATPTKDGRIRRKEWKDTISCIRYIAYIIDTTLDRDQDRHGDLRIIYLSTVLSLLGVAQIEIKQYIINCDKQLGDERNTVKYAIAYSHKLKLYMAIGIDRLNEFMDDDNRFDEVMCQQTLPNSVVTQE